MLAHAYHNMNKHTGNTIGHEWVLWTAIVTKTQEDKILRAGGKMRRSTFVSDGSTINTVIEDDVLKAGSSTKNGSMDIFVMCATRSHAYAMLGVAHFSLTHNLDAKIMTASGM